MAPPLCTEGKDCGSYYFATPYFTTFAILTAFIIVNMVVAVVMDNFTWTYALERLPEQAATSLEAGEEAGVTYVGDLRMSVDDHIIVSAQVREP